ncbi:MAG: 8-amino-7-oxononanoate synthase [Candidatus Polarisedimenticolaceae bacterium]|nr:8-amino-7-oxononanoate synthase [Candidatus Polarisedimenticolaceae bacterium]
MRDLQPALENRRQQQLYRRRRVVEKCQGTALQINGQPLINFCSNDYLGLAGHPDVAAAMQQGIRDWGVGSGAAHLVTGHTAAHHALEEALADFTGYPRALLFSSGYMANQGVITALMGRGDTLFQDRLNHASLIDGGLLSRAKLKRYPHNETTTLAEQMALASGEKMIITDGVFSMDGDLALLPALATIAAGQQAWLMVDDAHGLGVLGEEGRGSVDHFSLGPAEVPILMGTLGKAFGTFGAFVAGSEALIETLIQQARSYIYTTAPPAAVAEATRASLRIVRQESWRRERLNELIGRLREHALKLGLPLMDSPTPIQPIVAGDAGRALAWSQQLESAGILVGAIRPPTVPVGSARLRITLSAAHSDPQFEQLLSALSRLQS